MTGRIGADTSFLIEFFKGAEPAVAFMEKNAKRLVVSELVIHEFLCGNLTKNETLTFLGAMKSFPSVEFNRDAALISSVLFRDGKNKGRTTSHADCLIAGSYRAAGVTEIVTLNVKHFTGMQGVVTIHP